jgi:formate dehydrogenase alpha subunit
MTNSISDIEEAEVIMLTGTNTAANHPVIAEKIKQAVLHGGAKLIIVDPREISLSRYAQICLRPNPGTDVAWINGMVRVILEEGLYDEDFVMGRTEGFEDLRRSLNEYDPDQVEKITGIPAAHLAEAARLYARAERAAIFYAMGITQHISGTDNVMALANLALLCGNFGIRGAGINPLRGQNNVQGACDMGALPDVFTGYQKVEDQAAAEKFSRAWGCELPSRPGLTVIEMMNAALEGKIRAMYVLGENPMVTDPDLGHVEQALRSLDFLVVQDIFMTETAALADVVLPGTCFAEKDGTFTNTERRVQRVRKAVEPPKEAREDWTIVSVVAARMGYDMGYANSGEIMEEIASLTPSYGGINYRRLEKGGIQWPCPSADHPGTPVLHVETFPRGRGLLTPVSYLPPAELPDDEYPFLLTTGRMLYHYHTGSMSRRSDSLSRKVMRGRVSISEEDAARLGLREGEGIRLSSRRGSLKSHAHISSRLQPGMVFATFHFGEELVNLLTNPALDPKSKIADLKVCAVRIEKLEGGDVDEGTATA